MKKLMALTAIFIMSSAIAIGTGLPALAVGGTLFFGSLLTPKMENTAYAGLNKEIWIADIWEGFYADDMFLSECVDMDAFVENDTINLAEAGVDPAVLINNNSYPIATNQRTDNPIALPLDTYDTENTLIRSIEKAELSYDKRASVIRNHRNALRMTFMEYAAFRIAPASDTADTPIEICSGADNGGGDKRLTFADLARLRRRFDNAEIPEEGRIIVLSAQHMEDLEVEDVNRYNRVTEKGEILGFKIYKLAEKRLPRYNKTSGAKVAWGATAAPSTDVRASIAFHKDEVMRARGTMDPFLREKDPEQRGDILGFQMRGLSMPIRSKAVAAIHTEAV